MVLLIVNDEKMTANTMKQRIPWEQYGIEKVYTAYDAEAGKVCIEEYYIDIMLCDIEMPGENGISLLRWVREMGKDIECIFLTCHAKFAYAQEAMNLGCQDYILLPTKYENIGRTVQKVVDRIKQKREERRYQEYGKYMLKEQLLFDNEKNAKKEKASREEIVEKAIAIIMKNISDCDLSVEWISEQFHFHPVYMNRIFKEEKGVAISQFIMNARMELAAVILEKGECNVTDVAKKVGYRQYSNFYNMFKKNYGLSPAKYREKYMR